MEIAFPNSPLSGEKRISSLLGHQAPGYLPWEPVQDANPGPCLCVCLLSQGGCREADELRRGSVYSLHALSGIFWLLVNRKWSG